MPQMCPSGTFTAGQLPGPTKHRSVVVGIPAHRLHAGDACSIDLHLVIHHKENGQPVREPSLTTIFIPVEDHPRAEETITLTVFFHPDSHGSHARSVDPSQEPYEFDDQVVDSIFFS